jgi:hypothetical protein
MYRYTYVHFIQRYSKQILNTKEQQRQEREKQPTYSKTVMAGRQSGVMHGQWLMANGFFELLCVLVLLCHCV